MRRSSLVLLSLVLFIGASAIAQTPAPWQDGLVDHLSGTWKVEGQVMGHDAHHEIQADWVLNHQFLRIHEKTASTAPKTEHPYEATWFLGYDPISEKYVLHLMDIYGARFSETLGWGWQEGNQIKFVFEYPDGPFHTTFRWNPESGTWQWLMEQKGKDGKFTPFADIKLTKATSPEPVRCKTSLEIITLQGENVSLTSCIFPACHRHLFSLVMKPIT